MRLASSGEVRGAEGRLARRGSIEPRIVFQLGVAPCRIDILTAIDGVEFDNAWQRRTTMKLGDQRVPVLGREDLIVNKRATGRPRDLADLAWLESNQG